MNKSIPVEIQIQSKLETGFSHDYLYANSVTDKMQWFEADCKQKVLWNC